MAGVSLFLRFSNYLYGKKLKRQERLIKEWKPNLTNRWRSKIEEEIRLEYEEELERLGDKIYALNSEISSLVYKKNIYKAKYEASCETQDKLLNKVEKTSTRTGELKKEVKVLNTELEEIKETASQETIESPGE